MARPTYRAAVAWIALNDNGGADDGVHEIAGYISTCLVAELFSKKTDYIARDVLRIRLDHRAQPGLFDEGT